LPFSGIISAHRRGLGLPRPKNSPSHGRKQIKGGPFQNRPTARAPARARLVARRRPRALDKFMGVRTARNNELNGSGAGSSPVTGLGQLNKRRSIANDQLNVSGKRQVVRAGLALAPLRLGRCFAPFLLFAALILPHGGARAAKAAATDWSDRFPRAQGESESVAPVARGFSPSDEIRRRHTRWISPPRSRSSERGPAESVLCFAARRPDNSDSEASFPCARPARSVLARNDSLEEESPQEERRALGPPGSKTNKKKKKTRACSSERFSARRRFPA